jgi:hypothetical protein
MPDTMSRCRICWFDVPKDELESAITNAMTGSHFGPQVDFVQTPYSQLGEGPRYPVVEEPPGGNLSQGKKNPAGAGQ